MKKYILLSYDLYKKLPDNIFTSTLEAHSPVEKREIFPPSEVKTQDISNNSSANTLKTSKASEPSIVEETPPNTSRVTSNVYTSIPPKEKKTKRSRPKKNSKPKTKHLNNSKSKTSYLNTENHNLPNYNNCLRWFT